MSQYLYIAEYRDRFGGSCPSHKKIGIGENAPARMRALSDTKGTIDVVSLAVWKTADGKSAHGGHLTEVGHQGRPVSDAEGAAVDRGTTGVGREGEVGGDPEDGRNHEKLERPSA